MYSDRHRHATDAQEVPATAWMLLIMYGGGTLLAATLLACELLT